MGHFRKQDSIPFSNLAAPTGFQQQHSSFYFARNDSQKEWVIPSPDTLVFPKWEFGSQIRCNPTLFEAHYRESRVGLLRADVTKTRFLSVENFSEGIIARFCYVRWRQHRPVRRGGR